MTPPAASVAHEEKVLWQPWGDEAFERARREDKLILLDIGAVCQNTGTAVAICEALRFNKPLIERALTVTGEGVETPANYRVPLGTPVRAILDRAGLRDNANKLVLGGPMMGLAQYTADVAVTKGTSGILMLADAEAYESHACIRCGRCVDACPWHLVPSFLSIICEAKDLDAMTEFYALAENG